MDGIGGGDGREQQGEGDDDEKDTNNNHHNHTATTTTTGNTTPNNITPVSSPYRSTSHYNRNHHFTNESHWSDLEHIFWEDDDDDNDDDENELKNHPRWSSNPSTPVRQYPIHHSNRRHRPRHSDDGVSLGGSTITTRATRLLMSPSSESSPGRLYRGKSSNGVGGGGGDGGGGGGNGETGDCFE